MNKIILSIFTCLIILTLQSCKKDVGGCMDPVATNYNPDADFADNSLCNYNCSCGYITSDGIDSQTNCYWLEIENDCSGNRKKFCFDYNIWFNNYVGDHFCVTNVSSW